MESEQGTFYQFAQILDRLAVAQGLGNLNTDEQLWERRTKRRRKLGRGTTNLWAEWGWQTQLWWWGHLCNNTLGHGSATGICPSSCLGQKLEGLPSTEPWVVAAMHIAPGRPQAQWALTSK